MHALARNIRYALRALRSNLGLTAAAVVTLALGIGANTAIFSIVQAVLLQPLPYPHPERLYNLSEHERESGAEHRVAPPTYADWRSRSQTFESMTAVAGGGNFILTGQGAPERIIGANVSASFARTFDVQPILGRWFSRAEDAPGSDDVVVLSYALWQRRFGGDPDVIGRTVTLSDRRRTIVGVMPRGFDFPEGATRLWAPLATPPEELSNDQRRSHYLEVVARLNPDASAQAARAEMDGIARAIGRELPATNADLGVTLTPLRETIVGDVRPALLLLFGAVGFVLLIACVNVANLLLAGGSRRARELAVREALGASRRTLIGQMLVESALLGLAGGVAGLLLAAWARDLIVGLASSSLPRLQGVRLNLPVVAFALALSLITPLIFGLAPALIAARTNLSETLKSAGRAATDRRRLRSALVVAELAISLVLLAGAGLLINSLWRLGSVDPGFDADGVVTMQVVLPRGRYSDGQARAEFFRRALARVREVPGVTSAGATTNLPLSRTDMTYVVSIEGRSDDGGPLPAHLRVVSADYLSTLRIPLLRGRAITRADDADTPPVAVINETMAKRYWPDSDPIGQRISLSRGEHPALREIVGIVGDIHYAGLAAQPDPEVYVPYLQQPFFFMRFAVRSARPAADLAPALRSAVWAVDPDQPVTDIRPLTALVSRDLAPTRLQSVLLGAFAALALVLATVGIYGVMAYSVARRTREVGVRMALGARAADVLRLVVGQSARLVVVGLALGLIGAVAATQALSGFLYGVRPGDPPTLAGVAVVLAAVALLASWIPARRAARVDPVTALRDE